MIALGVIVQVQKLELRKQGKSINPFIGSKTRSVSLVKRLEEQHNKR